MAVQEPKEYFGVLDWEFLVLVVARLYLFIHPYEAYISPHSIPLHDPDSLFGAPASQRSTSKPVLPTLFDTHRYPF